MLTCELNLIWTPLTCSRLLCQNKSSFQFEEDHFCSIPRKSRLNENVHLLCKQPRKWTNGNGHGDDTTRDFCDASSGRVFKFKSCFYLFKQCFQLFVWNKKHHLFGINNKNLARSLLWLGKDLIFHGLSSNLLQKCRVASFRKLIRFLKPRSFHRCHRPSTSCILYAFRSLFFD